MKIVMQTVSEILDAIKDRIARDKLSLSDVIYTSSPDEVLRRVQTYAGRLGNRTIVFSSNVFYSTPDNPLTGLMNGPILASGVKGVDPHAWFFLYSLDVVRSPYIDGQVPKELLGDAHGKLVALLAFDFSQVNSVQELCLHFPWLT